MTPAWRLNGLGVGRKVIQATSEYTKAWTTEVLGARALLEQLVARVRMLSEECLFPSVVVCGRSPTDNGAVSRPAGNAGREYPGRVDTRWI